MSTARAHIEVTYPDGRSGTWHPQSGFAGDGEVVASARRAAEAGVPIFVPGHHLIPATTDTGLGALAALCSHFPADAQIVHLDASVAEALAASEDSSLEDSGDEESEGAGGP
jgi:hypothetical protein